MPGDVLYHASLGADWADARTSGEYSTSTRGISLEQEGFIHCSYRHQVEGVANRFYGDLDEVVLLTIDPSLLGVPVIEEPPADGIDELFPHVYGPIPTTAVLSAITWRRDADGRYRMP